MKSIVGGLLLLVTTSAGAIAMEGVEVEALRVEPAITSDVRVFFLVKNSNDYAVDVGVSCTIYSGDTPIGATTARATAVPPKDEAVERVLGDGKGDRARCRATSVDQSR